MNRSLRRKVFQGARLRKGFRRTQGESNGGSQMAKPAETKDYLADRPQKTSAAKRRNFWKLIKFPVFAAFGLLGLFLLFRSFNLYQAFFTQAGLRTIGGACTALQPFPLIGWVLQAGCDNISRFMVSSIALVTLIGLTCLMSIPVLVAFCPEAIESMVEQLRGNKREFQAISANSDDGVEVQTLVRRHQKLPDNALRSLALLSVGAFLIEAGMVYFVRGPKASIFDVLIDSLGMEALLIAFFVFRNAFLSKPKQTRVVD